MNRLAVQVKLDALKTPAERNVLGQFATPPELAREIMECALGFLPAQGSIRFLEPALGTGSFFEALSRTASDRLLSATGVEIDPVFASASKDLWRGSLLDVLHTDFTRLLPLGEVDLLVTNPPYVRHHHIDGEHKKALVKASERATGIAVSGLSGLYVHFMLLAHRWLAKGAVSAWLIPSEFMDVNYGEGLKRYLTERVRLLRIHRFCPEDVQFDDALVTSTVVFYENVEPSPNDLVVYSVGSSLNHPSESETVSIAQLRSTRKWSRLPAAEQSRPSSSAVLLEDAFTIKRGLVTGNNGFFMKRLSDFDEMGIPRQHLKPILPAPRNLTQPIVFGDAEGYPDIEPKMSLLDCRLSEDALAQDSPALRAYLEGGRANGVHETFLTGGRSPWYVQERRDPPPILCTYMGRQRAGEAPFRFIENRSLAVATNVYLLLYPKPWVKRIDGDGLLVSRVAEHLRTIGAKAFLEQGRVYGGGLHKMEPKELGRLSLDLPEFQASVLSEQRAFEF